MRVYIGLGSNLGDRAAMLRDALRAIDALDGVALVAYSHCYETEPVGVKDQPPFLNMAAVLETERAPLEVLDAVKDIERRLGRQPRRQWGPREIDVDLILWDEAVMSSDQLTLPHPAFRERAFVLVPLAEVAGGAVDPVTGKTVAELARAPEARGQVEKRQKLALTP